MLGLAQTKKKAAKALAAMHGFEGHDAAAERAVEAIVDAAREQVIHDIASRDPRVFDALRAAGMIA